MRGCSEPTGIKGNLGARGGCYTRLKVRPSQRLGCQMSSPASQEGNGGDGDLSMHVS